MSAPGLDDDAAFRFTIDLPVTSKWDDIALVRSSVEMCLSTLFHSLERSQTLAMVTGELLENAVKYGSWNRDSGVFRLRIWGSQGSDAFVQVSNPVASDDVAGTVLDAIRALRAAESPAEAYRARMIEIANGTGRSGSGLGLLRIAYEGACELDAAAAAGVVTVTARLAAC
jgi:hypothetical protein